MKEDNNQQEIILSTTSGFSMRELCEKLNYDNSPRQLSNTEKLAEACWSGLLHETMPEMIQKTGDGQSLYIWQIHHSARSLQIRLSNVKPDVDPVLSIDPHYFLKNIIYN